MTTFRNVYYGQPKFNKHSLIVYDATEISTNVHIYVMISCKPQLSFNTIIKLYVKFTRSIEQIMTLLNPTYNNFFHKPQPHHFHASNTLLWRMYPKIHHNGNSKLLQYYLQMFQPKNNDNPTCEK